MTAAVRARLVPVNSADLIPEANADEEFASLWPFFLDYTAENVKNYEESTSVLSLISTDRIFDPRLATKFQIAKIFFGFIFEYFPGEYKSLFEFS